MFKNIRASHSPVVPVKLLTAVFQDGGSVSVTEVVGVFQPPALTIWMFSLAVYPQLEYFFSFWIVKVTETIWLEVNPLYLHCGTNQITEFLGMLSSLSPICYGTPPNPHFVEGNKEKERTVKSGRNSVYGAPEHSCLLELVMEVHVTGKAASC